MYDFALHIDQKYTFSKSSHSLYRLIIMASIISPFVSSYRVIISSSWLVIIIWKLSHCDKAACHTILTTVIINTIHPSKTHPNSSDLYWEEGQQPPVIILGLLDWPWPLVWSFETDSSSWASPKNRFPFVAYQRHSRFSHLSNTDFLF